MILYAKWIGDMQVLTYDNNDGNGSASGSHRSGENVTLHDGTGFTKIEHYISGWNTLEDGRGTHYELGGSYEMPPNPATLYAEWSINTYTVSFNTNTTDTVTNIPSNQDVDYNDLASEPSAPLRAGYTFDRWYTESELINEWNFASDRVTTDTVLFANLDC